MTNCLDPVTLAQFFLQKNIPFECTITLASIDGVTVKFNDVYLWIFLWTLLLEAPFYLGYLLWRKYSLKTSLIVLVAANLATHPAVTFVIPSFTHAAGLRVADGAIIKEIFAPLVEMFIVKKMTRLSWAESFALAVAANLFSWWVGSLF
jgi:hypothetical protein